MMHRAWSSTVEVPYCFSRSYVKFQDHTAKKNRQIWPKLGVSGLWLQFEFTNGYEMLHKAWNSKGEMPYCFPRSTIKFQGHTVQNITDFDPNWAFLDYRSVAASNPSDLPCSRSSVKFQGHTALKIAKFDPDWAFPDCNCSLNTQMATKWCTKLEVA